MYYKVIYNQKVIDVLDKLQYCKYQLKHRVLLLCDETDAEGILASSGDTAYHVSTCQAFPVDIYPTVTLEEIAKPEYDTLVRLHLKSTEQITEELILDLMERGIL